MRPYVLSIAGFDPSGGAGVLADIKTMEQLRVQGLSVLTANTIQTEDQFLSVSWIEVTYVIKSITTLMSRYPIKVAKIGIVPNSSVLRHIITAIREQYKNCFIIWDPVLISSSGGNFFDEQDLPTLLQVVNALNLITPNAIEHQILQRYGVIEHAIAANCAILTKGGHRETNIGTDILSTMSDQIQFPAEEYINTSKHGSGCILSSAIAAYMALGFPLTSSCRKAKEYTARVLKSNTSLLGFHHE